VREEQKGPGAVEDEFAEGLAGGGHTADFFIILRLYTDFNNYLNYYNYIN